MPSVPSFTLDGRVAVVTGASSGLGVTLATGLAAAGADVVLVARRTAELAATADAVHTLGRRALTVTGDVADPGTGADVTARAMTEFGRVDVLVNNAGVAYSAPATRDEPGRFEQVLAVNLTGAYWMAAHCARVMLPGSSVVNVSSVHALTRSQLPTAAYAASKAGLLGLTRDLAAQWSRRRGIRVNAVVPGYFRSPLMDATEDEVGTQTVAERVLLERMGDPAELVGPVVFLASDASSYVTGTSLVVDGGLLA